MAGFDYIKELSGVANAIKTAALANAPYKTGNLKSKITTYNTLDKMIKSDGSRVRLNAGPPGAKYGKFWNEPATNKSRTKHRPEFGFADRAYKDQSVESALYNYARRVEKYLLDEFNSK